MLEALFQAYDIERIGRDFYLSACGESGDEALGGMHGCGRINVVLIATVLRCQTNELATGDGATLHIYLGSGILATSVGHLHYHFARLLIESSCAEHSWLHIGL